MSHRPSSLSWHQATTSDLREEIWALAQVASDMSANLRAADDSSLEDATRFLLETLRAGSTRLELAAFMVCHAAFQAGVPIRLLSQWTGHPEGFVEVQISVYDAHLRQQAKDERGEDD